MCYFRHQIIHTTLIAWLITSCGQAETKSIRLWSDRPPGSPTKIQDVPVLLMSQPALSMSNGAAVIVCPGGGYGYLEIDREGTRIAEWLNSFGVTAFILRYRHSGTGHRHPAPMLDGQRAIRTIREGAAEWKVDPRKIGVIGFSAGGHLASTLGTRFDSGDPAAADPIDRMSCRPDFMILCYPVISFTSKDTHVGSRDNLLGNQPDPELVKSLSNELQVKSATPPTFLFHTNEDSVVPPGNSIAYYEALRKAGVPAEIHIFNHGEHGVDLAREIPGTREWPNCCRVWLEQQVLSPKP